MPSSSQTRRTAQQQVLLLPALRGIFGDWIYYSCLMSCREIAKRVRFAEEIHVNRNLSDMIQRSLKSDRTEQIKSYLLQEKERFFNSLVIATYGGKPNWFQVAVKPAAGADISDAEEIKNEIIKLGTEASESLGLLRLSGRETMFALDGQHRLAGIKEAVRANTNLGDESLSVILVAHSTNQAGVRRTRRLFTTLNKTAVPVSKSEIIALDENDAAAIVVRRLVEENRWFTDNRIAFVAVTNIPSGNVESLTTIGNLYDVVRSLITRGKSFADRAEFLRKRPSDEDLDRIYMEVVAFFKLSASHIPELRQYFRARKPARVVRRYRNARGGSWMFRPQGMLTYVEIVAKLAVDLGIPRSIRRAAKLPRSLENRPLRNVVWNPSTRKIIPGNRVFLRRLFLHMLGRGGGRPSTLLQTYREIIDDEHAVLPAKV